MKTRILYPSKYGYDRHKCDICNSNPADVAEEDYFDDGDLDTVDYLCHSCYDKMYSFHYESEIPTKEQIDNLPENRLS